MSIFICQHCSRELSNAGGLGTHEKHCKSNPNYVKGFRSPLAGNRKGFIPWNKGKKGLQVAWNKGLAGTGLIKGKKHSEETKKKLSEFRKSLYASGWECVAGRCKKYEYDSPIAGKIKVDGSWELIFCKFADKKNLKWSRNKKRFNYIKPDGSSSTYQPDFFVEDWNSFVEVKGYETDVDRCKWSQFDRNLIVLRKIEIGEMDEWLKSTPC